MATDSHWLGTKVQHYGASHGLERSSNIVLHGSDTRPVRKENEVALQRAEMRMVRWMCIV